MKLASIETIADLIDHPNADRLSIAKVLGWQSIVKKNEFNKGDKIVFVVIDTILPNAPWSEFLMDKNNPEKPIRLRTVKLRGEYSQGLVLPLSVLPENVQGWHEGADVGGALGVKKYEKEIPAQLSGIALGAFPTYICAQTDEDNGLSNPDLVNEVLSNKWITVTQKLDGCVIGSTIIKTDSGDKTIQEIVDNKLQLKALSFNPCEEVFGFKEIINWFDHGITEDWIEIQDEDGNNITVTPNHKVWLPVLKCYREAKDLRINDTILLKN
jgi:RNA ligase (TIGR02306 family)